MEPNDLDQLISQINEHAGPGYLARAFQRQLVKDYLVNRVIAFKRTIPPGIVFSSEQVLLLIDGLLKSLTAKAHDAAARAPSPSDEET